MARNIYEKILEKYSLDELKAPKKAEPSLEVDAPVSAEQSLEKITLSTPVLSPEKALSVPVTSPKKESSSKDPVWPKVVFFGVVLGLTFSGVYMSKRSLQYEFDGYIEKENGAKIIYLSKWTDDELVGEVISVNSGEEVIICDNDSCLGEATKIALEYKSNILEEKKTKFNELLKE